MSLFLSPRSIAQTADEFLGYAREYADALGYTLSSEAEASILQSIETNISEIRGQESRIEETLDAIEKVINAMQIGALDSDQDGQGKPTLGAVSLALALQQVCPLWPFCSE